MGPTNLITSLSYTIYKKYHLVLILYALNCANTRSSVATVTMAKADSTPFTIYTDQDPSLLGTPNGIYHNLLDEESIVACIEDGSSPLSTRRTSAMTNITSVSSMPASLPPEKITTYTLHKPRTVFRSPSTFPTLQMASPTSIGTPGSNGSRRYVNQRRRVAAATDAESHIRGSPGTPMSARSQSVLSNHSQAGSYTHPLELEGIESHSPETPSKSQTQLPLVLLHVTLLSPSRPQYSKQLLDKINAPAYIEENQRLLEEKLSETVRTRGILIPHPGEEYDLLEERLLESLELCAPRLLGCGHFYGGERANEEDFADVETASAFSHDSGKGSSHCSSSTERLDIENDMCPECSQPMHLPGKGIGSGSRRFDIKIYAANGLMRAGAWGAAWREMERVDVEIDVWMPEAVRRELEQEIEREEEENHNRIVQEESLLQRADAAIEALSKANAEVTAARNNAEQARMNAEEQTAQLQEEMDKLTAASQSRMAPIAEPEPPRKVLESTEPSSYVRNSDQDVSLTTLLRKAVVIASRDPRNITITTLSFLVLLLALTLGSPKQAPGGPAVITSTPSRLTYCTPLARSTVTNTIVVTNTDIPITTTASTPSLGQQANTACTPNVSGVALPERGISPDDVPGVYADAAEKVLT